MIVLMNHFTFSSSPGHIELDFQAQGDNTCSRKAGVGREPPRYSQWEPRILRAVTNFTATIGPTGGDRGYPSATRQYPSCTRCSQTIYSPRGNFLSYLGNESLFSSNTRQDL